VKTSKKDYFIGVSIVPFREIMAERARLEKLLPLCDLSFKIILPSRTIKKLMQQIQHLINAE